MIGTVLGAGCWVLGALVRGAQVRGAQVRGAQVCAAQVCAARAPRTRTRTRTRKHHAPGTPHPAPQHRAPSTQHGAPLLLALCLAGALARPAFAAVDDYLGKPVASVRLMIEGRETTEPALRQLVENTVGRPLSLLEVRESIVHLFSLRRFEDVRADAALENGRVALRYELTPLHPIARFSFEGPLDRPGIDRGALRRAILDRYGAAPPLGKTTDMVRIAADALRQRGYLHPTITPRADVSHQSERASLVLAIDPGARTAIRDVEVAGTPSVPRAEFLSRLGLAPGAPYQREALNARIDKYVADRRRHGYYEAKVLANVQLHDDDRVADVTVTVNSGPHVRVVFAGDSLRADKREELVPVEREGSVDEDLLEDSSNRIEEYLRSLGYRAAKAPHTRESVNGELVVRFTVTRGPQYRTVSYEVTGGPSMPLAEFQSQMRLREGQPFADARLDADRAAIEQWYHRNGYPAAKALAGVDVPAAPAAGPVPVTARIVVTEGALAIVSSVTFTGNHTVEEAALGPLVRLQPGAPFVPAELVRGRDAVQLAYLQRGFENATVDAAPVYDESGAHVDVRFTIREGAQIFIDHVIVAGNVRTRTATIEHELTLHPGSPLNPTDVAESERRLATLGLFRRARITELPHGNETTRDVLVTVDEAPPTTIGGGGGVEGRLRVVTETGAAQATEQFEIAPRAFFEIGRRNLFGSNRSANLFTSGSLHPQDPGSSSGAGAFKLPEYRVVGTFREPRLFNTPADALVNVTFEQQIRSSFNFRRNSASAQVARRVSRDVSVIGGYQIQRTELVGVKIDSENPSGDPLLNRLFSTAPLRLSSFSASVVDDTRNDTVNPGSGRYLSVSGQLTARAIGSQIGFAKSIVTAQTFHTLPASRGAVFAASARLGMASEFAEDQPIPEPERFFAGGDTTVRGFALDTLGRPDTLSNGFPIGGNALAIFNVELRLPVLRDAAASDSKFGVVGFIDTGNVFKRVSDLDLAELRTAAGGGVRFKSPFGPIRVDLGFKLRRQENEGLTAWFVSFGQAF